MQNKFVSEVLPREDLAVDVDALAIGACVLLAVGTFGDLVTTAVGLQIGLHEVHPLVRSAYHQAGLLGLVGSKVAVVALAAGLSDLIRRTADWIWIFVPATIGSMYSVVSVWNLLLIVEVIA